MRSGEVYRALGFRGRRNEGGRGQREEQLETKWPRRRSQRGDNDRKRRLRGIRVRRGKTRGAALRETGIEHRDTRDTIQIAQAEKDQTETVRQLRGRDQIRGDDTRYTSSSSAQPDDTKPAQGAPHAVLTPVQRHWLGRRVGEDPLGVRERGPEHLGDGEPSVPWTRLAFDRSSPRC